METFLKHFLVLFIINMITCTIIDLVCIDHIESLINLIYSVVGAAIWSFVLTVTR